jgi:hypothetical protein
MSGAKQRLYYFIKFSRNRIFQEEEERNEELARKLATAAAATAPLSTPQPAADESTKRAAEPAAGEEPQAKRVAKT